MSPHEASALSWVFPFSAVVAGDGVRRPALETYSSVREGTPSPIGTVLCRSGLLGLEGSGRAGPEQTRPRGVA
jgi:hypothetical protein